MAELDHSDLLRVISYDQNTGIFVWSERPGNRSYNARLSGKNAGQVESNGYIRIRIFGTRYLAHRLAWFYLYKIWPVWIDHINGDRADNRIDNLRECLPVESAQNRKVLCTNKSGFTGVHWAKRQNKWRAVIYTRNYFKSLGYFESKDEADAAYRQAKTQYHTFNPIQRGRQ